MLDLRKLTDSEKLEIYEMIFAKKPYLVRRVALLIARVLKGKAIDIEDLELDEMTVEQLKQFLKNMKAKFSSKSNKDELLALAIELDNK